MPPAILEPEQRALSRGRQLLAEHEYEAAEFVSSPLLRNAQSYVRVMAGYYMGWAAWGRGILRSDIRDLPIDQSTTFGRAMAHQMFAWHLRRRLDFPGHLKSLRTAVTEFLRCEPIPYYWLAVSLVPLLHTAFETADEESFILGRQAFNACEWTADLEHQRFDCLRALSRYSFTTGNVIAALKYIADAKCCKLPHSCRAYALLHSASYGLELNERMWVIEQLCSAERLIEKERDESCVGFRSVILALAMQYSEVDAHKAQGYLAEYHRIAPDQNTASSHDKHLDIVADISLGKIGLSLEPQNQYALEMIERSYSVAVSYGFRYRSSIAAAEIAGAQKKRGPREEWLEKALEQIAYYGDSSPLRKLLSRKMQLAHLTDSEKRAFSLVGAGKSNAEIAAQMCLTEGSVANILSAVYKKCGVTCRSALISQDT